MEGIDRRREEYRLSPPFHSARDGSRPIHCQACKRWKCQISEGMKILVLAREARPEMEAKQRRQAPADIFFARCRLLPLLATFLTVLVAGGTLRAQGPPINTDTAFVTGLQGAALRSFFFSVRRSGLLQHGRSVFDPLDRKVSVVGLPIVVPYEVLKNRLVVIGGIPILHKELRITPADGIRRELSDTGFGDLFIVGKYQLLQKDNPGKTTRITALGRVKFPTGDDNETDAEGDLLPAPLQLGTGSVDYSAGVIFTHIVRRIGFNADVVYNFNTEANNFTFGDTLRYDVALGYRIIPKVYDVYPAKQLNAYLELNGQFAQRNVAGGITLRDSGGSVVLLSSGIQFIPLGTFLVEASLQIPVVQDLNGTQIKFRPGFNIGFRWLIL